MWEGGGKSIDFPRLSAGGDPTNPDVKGGEGQERAGLGVDRRLGNCEGEYIKLVGLLAMRLDMRKKEVNTYALHIFRLICIFQVQQRIQSRNGIVCS